MRNRAYQNEISEKSTPFYLAMLIEDITIFDTFHGDLRNTVVAEAR